MILSEESGYIGKFSSQFEPALLVEMKAKTMLRNVNGGETLLQIGQPVRAVPLVLSGAIKVSRVNEEGQELLLYYVKEGESCPMTFTCWMTKQNSTIKGSTDEDTAFLAVPVNVVDEWFLKYPTFKTFVMTTILNGLT